MSLPTWEQLNDSSLMAGKRSSYVSEVANLSQHRAPTRSTKAPGPTETRETKPLKHSNSMNANASEEDTSRHSYNNNNDSFTQENYGKSDNRYEREQAKNRGFDEFRYRELCLNAASKSKLITTYLSKIKDYIVKEASLEWEVAASYGSFMDESENSHGRMSSSFLSCTVMPKEAELLSNSSNELQRAAWACIKAVSECFDCRKTMYLTQLKKIREQSNMATRNAVQHERSEAAIKLSRLQEALDTQRRTEVRTLEDTVAELQTTVANLRNSAEHTREELGRLTQLEHDRVNLQAAAVVAAVQQCREEHRAEKDQWQAQWTAEKKRVQTEAQAQIEEARHQNEHKLQVQKEHEAELRNLVLQDKTKADTDLVKLREEMIHSVARLTSEKDRGVARLQEERERAERDQQAALAEAIKGQATLRAEMAAMTQRVKTEELKRNALQDMELTKYRESLLTSHSLEIEKINDRHRNEMKKYHVELQVRNQDSISKLKHIHEQELNRLIRDNDRLQRIIVRHGGAELFRSVGGTTDYLSSPLGASAGGVDDSRMSEMSFENAAQSPGMTFRNAPFTSSGSTALGAQHAVSSTGTGAAKSGNKSPLYSSKIRGSLTPPGKFRRSPEQASFAPSSNNQAGQGGRSVNFSGQDHVHHLSDKYAPSPDASGGDGSAAAGNNNAAGGSANTMRVPESPPPPPRQNLANVLNWGALNQSLNMQERDEKTKFSASHMPPDGFTLNESLSATKSARNGKLGIGIEANALRVGKYMSKLEDYLQQGSSGGGSHRNGHDSDNSVDLNTVNELPQVASMLDSSSHSSLNFTAQAATKYQQARERHGLMPRSPAYDSDSDGASSDSLYGEDIPMDVSGNTSRSSKSFISP